MNAHVSYDIDELVAAITPDNVHGEADTGDAVGNEAGSRLREGGSANRRA